MYTFFHVDDHVGHEIGGLYMSKILDISNDDF